MLQLLVKLNSVPKAKLESLKFNSYVEKLKSTKLTTAKTDNKPFSKIIDRLKSTKLNTAKAKKVTTKTIGKLKKQLNTKYNFTRFLK